MDHSVERKKAEATPAKSSKLGKVPAVSEFQLEEDVPVKRPRRRDASNRRHKRLNVLVNAISPENRHQATDWGKPAGKEIWYSAGVRRSPSIGKYRRRTEFGEAKSRWELIRGGVGIHWEGVDEGISVARMLQRENFMRLLGHALQSTSRAPRRAMSTKTVRAAR